jgi:hypothetical protein
MSYLPSLADLPPGFEWTNSLEARHQNQNNNPPLLDYLNSRHYSDSARGWLFSEMRIAAAPFENGFVGQPWEFEGTLVETAPVGQFSEAHLLSEDPIRSAFRFIKGNILVTLQGPISVDDAVKIAQNLEQRLPEHLTTLTPITFPETLDPIAAAQFENWMLGECTPDSEVAEHMTVIEGRLGYCAHFDWVAQEPFSVRLLEYAVYDLNNQEYVIKYSAAHGFGGMLFTPGMPGNYELRVAKDDVLVAILPFEVR